MGEWVNHSSELIKTGTNIIVFGLNQKVIQIEVRIAFSL